MVLAGLDLLAEVEPGLAVTRDDVVRGFAALKWPARVEVVGQNPWLVIDGAHNVASATALADTLRTCFPPTSRTLVFGTTRDKDLAGQLQVLLPCFDTIIATRYVENPRSVPPESIADQIAAMAGRPVRIAPGPAPGAGPGPRADRIGWTDLCDRLALPGCRSAGDRCSSTSARPRSRRVVT